MQQPYSSSLNGASCLLFELKQVIKLKVHGASNTEIRKRAVENNLFQFESLSRTRRVLPSIMKRADVIDETLTSFMLDGSIDVNKMINLYAIMKTDRLFFEFMDEVIKVKWLRNDGWLEKKDLNLFFAAKSEQSDKAARWSGSNIEKLKRAYLQALFESGLLKERMSGALRRPAVYGELKRHLIRIGDGRYIQVMGEGVTYG